MIDRVQRLWAWLHTPTGVKMFRYTLVSVVSVAVSQVVLFLTFGVFRVWSAVWCNVFAAAVATVPSYYLNRYWAWGKTGRSHLLKEVIPFWALAFLGLGVSVWAVDLAEKWARDMTSSHLGVSIIVNFASLLAYGVVWVGKFVIFNRLLFIDHDAKKADKQRRRAALLAAGSSPPPSGKRGLNDADDGWAVAADG